MGTNKEKIMLYMEKNTKDKIEYISSEENRSMNNWIMTIIQREIKRYEIENGNIEV